MKISFLTIHNKQHNNSYLWRINAFNIWGFASLEISCINSKSISYINFKYQMSFLHRLAATKSTLARPFSLGKIT